MKIAFAALVLSLAATPVVMAQSTATTTEDQTSTATSTQPPAKPKDSPLVKAAKQSGTTPKIPKKAITNADVKKSKGKLTTTSPKPLPTTTRDESVPDPRTVTEVSEAEKRALKSAEDRVAAAKTKFDALEKDLAAIEQSYYQERDPNVRDTVIQQRFAQTKRQLDAARKDLADARDARDALTKR